MKIIRIILIAILSALAIAFSLGWKTSAVVQPKDAAGFSAVRVAQDIKVISKEHHSVENPEQRKTVADYLVSRLESMGLEPQVFLKDSVRVKTGKDSITTDLRNIYVCVEPEGKDKSSSYVMLMAHYDSRWHNTRLGNTVLSYGAADDGYGVGVNLELLHLVLQYRGQWKQGIKVLFTDCEECGCEGVKFAWNEHSQIFENVGLVINIEAMGVKGPAVMFETSPGNKALVDLYLHANKACAYSISSEVYNIMPNNTDFTTVKDSIPGFNFSVVDNLNYYHTDLDCYENISLKSIQNYGSQITPILQEYLCGQDYSDPDYLKSDSDTYYYSAPLSGLFDYNRFTWWFAHVFTWLIVIIIVLWLITTGKVSIRSILHSCARIFAYALGLAAAGFLVSWLAAIITGTSWKLIHTCFVDSHFWIFGIMAAIGTCLAFWMCRGGDIANALAFIIISFILSIIILLIVGDDLFIFIPLTGTIFVYNMCLLKKWCRILAYLGIFIILLVSVCFFYIVFSALTIGALGLILFLIWWIAGLIGILVQLILHPVGPFQVE